MPTYHPTFDEFQRLAVSGAGNLIPVYREVRADLETPVSAFLKIARGPHSFLLESVEGGERVARYTFMGTEPYRVLSTGPGQRDGAVDPLTLVQQELGRFQPVLLPGLPRFVGGAVGYVAFECAHYFESRVPVPAKDSLGLPESIFLFTDSLVVFDHVKHVIQVLSHAHIDGNLRAAYDQAVARVDALVSRLRQLLVPPAPVGPHPSPAPSPHRGEKEVEAKPEVESNNAPERYHWMVNRAKDYVVAGDVIQVVPSQRLSRRTTAAPFDIYRALRAVNPSPYMYYLHLDTFDIVGASPELLVRVEDGVVDTHPIAGTRRRGATEAEDAALERELRSSEKECAEHVMLLDLGRNDIGRVSRPGTVRVTQMLDVERYSHVMHLVSHVTGDLAPGLSAYDALRSCFPAGTVSGAPKIRAMEIIVELEGERRGTYAGAVGYFGFNGNMDTAIAIRTMVVKDGVAYMQAGGGVVYDSEPEPERQESLAKADALLRALDVAESDE